MIAHIVLFTLKPGIEQDKMRSFAQVFNLACAQIPAIKRARVGRATEVDAGYARSFGEKTYECVAVLEFEDASGLREYLNHPLHDTVGRMFWETCESTTIFEGEILDPSQDDLSELLAGRPNRPQA